MQAKKGCYSDLITINDENSAEIKMQVHAGHTVQRLVNYQMDVLGQKKDDLTDGLSIIYKWGCDGHSIFQQKCTSQKDTETDSSLFAVCTVSLQLKSIKENTILLHNPRPSLIRFWRPISSRRSAELSQKGETNRNNSSN